nr:YihY/virulence factor BrkB family protein [Natrinema salaciae]
MIDHGRGFDVTRRVLRLAKDQQLTLLAAGVAYYGFLSLIPLMLLALGLAASIGGDVLANRLTAAASDVLTVQAQQLLTEAVTDQTGRRGATVAGILGLLWGSSRVLRGLDRAFSQVYGTVGEKSLLDTIWDAMIVSLVITAGLALVGALELAFRFLPGIEIGVVGQLFVVLGLFVTFLPLYVVFPNANVGVREATPGTVIAAVGWFVLSRTFSLYASLLTEYAIYGALGAAFLVLIWLYVGAIILVFAAVVNAVLANREVDRQLQSPGHRQISTEAMTDDATGADEGATEDRASDRATARSASARTRDRSSDAAALREEIERLRDRVDAFEDDVENRTVRKESLEGDLKRYVRRRVRRGHAQDWGPYLVLLYGTAMSIAAFYFLDGPWAILSMLVVWTSTLGVYVLMVLFGFGISVLGLPGRLRNAIGDRRS